MSAPRAVRIPPPYVRERPIIVTPPPAPEPPHVSPLMRKLASVTGYVRVGTFLADYRRDPAGMTERIRAAVGDHINDRFASVLANIRSA